MPGKSRQRFAIVVDGECEFWYIQMLKRNERSINVNLEPKIPQKKKLSDQFDKVMELAEEYQRVFWIVDFDVIINETRKTNRSEKTSLTDFIEFSNKVRDSEIIEIIINNPCLEYWFLLHFVNTSWYFDSCSSVITKIQSSQPLSTYEKTEKYYTKQDHDIYLRLKPFLTNAILHAKSLPAFDFSNPESGMTQMHRLFETKGLNSAGKKG